MTKLGLIVKIIKNLLAKGGSSLETSLDEVQVRCIHYLEQNMANGFFSVFPKTDRKPNS